VAVPLALRARIDGEGLQGFGRRSTRRSWAEINTGRSSLWPLPRALRRGALRGSARRLALSVRREAPARIGRSSALRAGARLLCGCGGGHGQRSVGSWLCGASRSSPTAAPGAGLAQRGPPLAACSTIAACIHASRGRLARPSDCARDPRPAGLRRVRARCARSSASATATTLRMRPAAHSTASWVSSVASQWCASLPHG